MEPTSSRPRRPSAAGRCQGRRCRRAGLRCPAARQPCSPGFGPDRRRSSGGSSATRSSSTCGRSSPRTTTRGRGAAGRRRRWLRRRATGSQPRRRHGRAHRPRQDDAPPRAHRDRRGPAARGAAARDDHRRRLRAPRARRRARDRLRGRPGHDRLVGNMLVGAGEVDAALLVVAADDGPNAQTLEHLELLDALGIRRGIAVVTKADLAPDEARRAELAPRAGRWSRGRRWRACRWCCVGADGGGDRRGPGGARGAWRRSRRRTPTARGSPSTGSSPFAAGAPS